MLLFGGRWEGMCDEREYVMRVPGPRVGARGSGGMSGVHARRRIEIDR